MNKAGVLLVMCGIFAVFSAKITTVTAIDAEPTINYCPTAAPTRTPPVITMGPTQTPTPYDGSELFFPRIYKTTGNCNDGISIEVCNKGKDMIGATIYEVWNGIDIVASGNVDSLSANTCTTISYDPEATGDFIFKVRQKAGFDGDAYITSSICTINTCVIPTPTSCMAPSATPIPTSVQPTITSVQPTNPPENSPTSTPGPNNNPGPTSTPVPAPTATPAPKVPDNRMTTLGISDAYNPLLEGILGTLTSGKISGIKTVQTDARNISFGKKITGNKKIEGLSLSIPRIDIDEPVYEGKELGEQLLVGNQEVLTGTLNDARVFYAHNSNDKFGKLYRLGKGDSVVIDDNNQKVEYKVEDKIYTYQDNMDAIVAKENTMYLITCSYTNPSYRHIVKIVKK